LFDIASIEYSRDRFHIVFHRRSAEIRAAATTKTRAAKRTASLSLLQLLGIQGPADHATLARDGHLAALKLD
jgi:hypothetical protein